MALISQSGSNAAFLYQMARWRGVSFNKMVSSGNEADLSCIDFLDYFSRDPRITVITAYLEGIKDTREFMGACSQASLRKPVVVLKVGDSNAAAGPHHRIPAL
jgi:acyl-CoA synthetase (NDP forming)